jgi:hypothetical protein
MVSILILAGCGGKHKAADQTPAVDRAPTKVPARAEMAKVKLPPTSAKKSPIKRAGGARITFEETVHDFGKLSPGSRNVCEFKFTNTGTAVLRIVDITKTCGCTPWQLDKREYKPQESGVIKVNYNAGRHPGEITKHLYVKSNDPVMPKLGLTIKGNIVLAVVYEPKVIKLFLKGDKIFDEKIILRSVDGKEFSINSIRSTGGTINIPFDPKKKATEFVLKPEIDKTKLRSGQNGRIDIGLTHPDTRSVSIAFNALANYRVTPAALILTKAEPGVAVKRTLWVLGNYEQDFSIAKISSKTGLIKLLKTTKVSNRYKVDVEIVPPSNGKTRIFNDILTIKLNDGDTLDVNCSGFYK